MFGLLRPCSRLLPQTLHRDWLAHFCGLCLSLRDDFGQPTRLATNYDSLILSVLVDAQTEAEPRRRRAGPCALRGLRTASVAQGEAARLAAVASVLLASAKITDHIDDGDGLARMRPIAGIGRRVSARLTTRALRVSEDLDFDADAVLTAVGRRPDVEAAARPGTPLTAVTAPAEAATATLFAHTATLAGQPGNREPLARAGAAFGRLAHLVDAVGDLDADTERGAWNPLRATETSMAEAHRLCHAAIRDIDAALTECRFQRDDLTRSLLVDHAAHTMRASYPHHHPGYGYHQPPVPRGFWAGCGAAILVACTCRCCCSNPFEGPWSRKPREGCCHKCDCDCCGCDGCC